MSDDITVCTVPVYVLKALLLVAGEDPVRYYLNGTFVDVPNNRLVTTDGSCALIVKEEMTKEALDASVRPFIIPRDIIEQAVKAVRKSVLPGIDVRVAPMADGQRQITLVTAGSTFGAKEIDGRYPDYTRIVPKFVTGKIANYSPALVWRLHKALALTMDKKPEEAVTRILHNGDGGAPMVASSQESLAVLMPWNADPIDPDVSYRGLGFPELTEPPAPERDEQQEAA